MQNTKTQTSNIKSVFFKALSFLDFEKIAYLVCVCVISGGGGSGGERSGVPGKAGF